jgi:hypothetical protein
VLCGVVNRVVLPDYELTKLLDSVLHFSCSTLLHRITNQC